MKQIVGRQRDAVRMHIADLRRLERDLEIMLGLCSGRKIPDRPVVDSLFDRGRSEPTHDAPQRP